MTFPSELIDRVVFPSNITTFHYDLNIIGATFNSYNLQIERNFFLKRHKNRLN